MGHVSRRRRKAESQVGRGEFSKPWAEREKERGVGRKDEETGRRESARGAGLMVLLSCSLCSGVKSAREVPLSGKQRY